MRELLRSWLTKAANDLRTARILDAAADGPLDTAIYHCQQAAEKAVKAFLISHAVTPEKTHDVRKLAVQASGFEARFNELIELAAALTPTHGNSATPAISPKHIPSAKNSMKHCNMLKPFTISC